MQVSCHQEIVNLAVLKDRSDLCTSTIARFDCSRPSMYPTYLADLAGVRGNSMRHQNNLIPRTVNGVKRTDIKGDMKQDSEPLSTR